jgi:hypothetical protein
LLKTLIRPRASLFFPILSSLLIHALLLVNVLAPSALTVAPSEQVSREIEVPIFNLTSQAQFSRVLVNSGNLSLETLSLTATGDEKTNSILLNLPELTWAIPQDCGLKCAFYFIYNSPGLECHDVIPGGPQAPQDPMYFVPYVYKANSSLYSQNVTTSPSQQIGLDVPYDLSINYTGITNAGRANMTFSPTAGTYCRFYQAIYNASFEFNGSDSTQRASTSIISHGNYLTWWDIATEATSPNEFSENVASWAICYAFAQAFRGGSLTTGNMSYISQAMPVLASIFKVNLTESYSFELAVSNLTQHVVDLFSNLTLGLISTRGGQDPVIANGTVWNGSSVWIYTSWVLWAAYLPAMILAISVALYGLYTIHLSGIAMDDKFSSFWLATQNAELSEMCKKAAAFDELQRLQLIHEKNGTFVVIDSSLKSPN